MMDIFQLPTSACGNHYVVVTTDLYTKYAELHAIAKQTTKTVADCLVDYVSHFGVPHCTDRSGDQLQFKINEDFVVQTRH